MIEEQVIVQRGQLDCFIFIFHFLLWGEHKVRRLIGSDWVISGNGVHDVKFPKN